MKKIVYSLFFLLLVTQICFGQWVQVGLNNQPIIDIAIQDAIIFAITSDSGKVFRSINNGSNWTMIVDSCALDVDISPTGKVFMVRDSSLTSWPSALYSSLDNGVTWTLVEDLPYFSWDTIPRSISVSPVGYLFLGEFFGWGLGGRNGFAMSTDDGLVWIDPPPGNIWGGRLFDFNDQQAITYGTHGGPTTSGIYFYSSMDYGSTWDSLYFPFPSEETYFLFNLVTIGLFTNGDVIIGTEQWSPSDSLYGVYISTDLCSTWTQITKINCKSGLSWSSGSSEGMLIGTEDLGVFLFSDMGDSLGSRNEGLTNLNIQALSLDNNGYVYAGTENGVWRRPLSEVTSVKDVTTPPTEFILEQNYPNPFNPNTVINYQLPVSSEVTIKVFDVLGNEIATLIDEYKPVGRYEVEWEASGLPSGVYFYQLKASNYIETKKMLLLK